MITYIMYDIFYKIPKYSDVLSCCDVVFLHCLKEIMKFSLCFVIKAINGLMFNELSFL